MAAILTRPTLLKRHRIKIHSEGDLVVLNLGNVQFRMPYDDALLLSQFIRVRAKEAKRRAGDRSRHWSIIGTLHDANYGPDHTGFVKG